MSTYQQNKHFYSNHYNDGIPKLEHLDKIEDVLEITDPIEMDNNIFKNILTVTKILKCIYKRLCDNYFLIKEEIDLLLYALKFVDTLNLFMTKQSIEQISGLIYEINEIIFSMHNFESKEMILKKIRYTEMTIIYFKKKYFKNLFFGEGKLLGNEIEKCLELVTQNGTFDQKTFKQMQNIFYVVQGKIDEKYRSEIQIKLNELKTISLKHKSEKYSINDDYKDYVNSKSFPNDDYYDNFNENNVNNNNNQNGTTLIATPNTVINSNNYSYYGNSGKSYDNGSFYNQNYDNCYYQWKKSAPSINKQNNYKSKYYNYNNQNGNKGNTYLVEIPTSNNNPSVINPSTGNENVTNPDLNSNKSGNTNRTDDLNNNNNNSCTKEVPLVNNQMESNCPVNLEEKPEIVESSPNFHGNNTGGEINEYSHKDNPVNKYEGQVRSNSYGPKKIQNYYNDNFFKNYVYYYEKPTTVATNTKESNVASVSNTVLTSNSVNVNNNQNNNITSNNSSNSQIETIIQQTSTNSNYKPNLANATTPVKVNNNNNKQQRSKYKRNYKMTTYEQVLYSDNNSCTDNNKATTQSISNTIASNITSSAKVEELNNNINIKKSPEPEEITTTVEIQNNTEKEEEKPKVVNDPLPETTQTNIQQQASSNQPEIGRAEPSNQIYNKKGYNNNYNNYKNNTYKNYNMAYTSNYNYSNYGYNNGNYYTKNNYYNNSANTNNTAYEYDYNYNNYSGSNKTYKNEVESNYTNSTNSNKNSNTNKDVSNHVSNFNSHNHNYNYNYNNTTNYKKNSLANSLTTNTHSQSNNYYNNNFKNTRTKNNSYANKYRNSYDHAKKYDNNNIYREVDLTKLDNSEAVNERDFRKDSNYCDEQNVIENNEDTGEFTENNQGKPENVICNKETYTEDNNENLLNNYNPMSDSNLPNLDEKQEENVKVEEKPSNNTENIQTLEVNKELLPNSEENITVNNSRVISDMNYQEIPKPSSMNNLYPQENRTRPEMMNPDNLNAMINRGELVDMDVEKMFAADIHPRNTDSDVYNEENYHYDEEGEESADEEFEEQEEEEEEEDEEIQNIIDNEIEQLNARHAENELMHEEDEDADSDSADNEIIEAEFDKFMRETNMSITNNMNVNYKMKDNEDNYYGNETKNNKIIFEEDNHPTSLENKKENTRENLNVKTVETKSVAEENVENFSKNEQNKKISENNDDPNNNLINIQTEEKNVKETTKNFMDSLKNIDPKLLMEIKNKINENNTQTNHTIGNSQFNQFNQFGFQGTTFPNSTTPIFPTTHINPLNLDSTTQQTNNQNQISYEDYIKQHQMNFTGMNNKFQLQNFIFTNYSHFFYRGRDSNIHREYFALKCLEQENSPIITNNLEAFEKKILIPIYQRINFNVNKKKGIYLYTFTKYKKLIYRVLSKEKILKKVKPYGSYMNNFLIDSGDIDICIVPKCSILEFSNSLEKIKEEITSNNYGEHKLTHNNSRYMLLKIVDHQTKFVIDITVHNMLPILNTNLIRLYSLYDQRFHILGLYVKHWSKINKIHGAADNYLSSYAMLMMLIYFLQNVVEPKVLPNLQSVEKKEIIYEFNQNGEMVKTNIYYEEDVQKIKTYMNNLNNGRENKDSATQLLMKFFEYYSYYFDYFEQKIAIHKIPNDLLKKTHDNIAFSIEDPFDPHHNPGKSMLINSNQFNKFITSMKKEINLIMNGEYIKRLEKMNTSGSN